MGDELSLPDRPQWGVAPSQQRMLTLCSLILCAQEVRSPNDGSASSSSAYPQLNKQQLQMSEEKSVPSPTNASHATSASSQIAPPTPDAGLHASSMQLLNKYDVDPAQDANGDNHGRQHAVEHDEDTEPKTTDRRL